MPERPSRAVSERWRDWRNGLVADPGFQRLAARIPFVRRIAARRAAALFDLCAGFVYSQVLFACVRLGVLRQLADGPLEVATLSRQCGLDATAMRTLLDAAASLGLVERRAGGPLRPRRTRCRVARQSRRRRDDRASRTAVCRPRRPRVAAAAAVAAQTRLAGHWPYAAEAQPGALTAERVRGYTELMSASQPLVADRHPRRLRLFAASLPARRGRRRRHVPGAGRASLPVAASAAVRPAGGRGAGRRAARRRGLRRADRTAWRRLPRRCAAARRRRREPGAHPARPRRRRCPCAAAAQCDARWCPAERW